MKAGPAARLAATRRMLGAIFLFGSVGTSAELMLMGHTEGVWQIVPLILMAIGCGVLALVANKRGVRQLLAFQLVLILFVFSGVAGVLVHYKGNAEFELELNPDLSGIALFSESMKGATPTLAPGTMILLGALGFGYAYLIGRE